MLLKDYFKTIKKEENIQILNKESSNNPYFLRLGWASTDKGIKLPNKNSLWKADKKNYVNEEINLFWENGEGLTFKRRIKIDKNFMILVEDEIINKSGKNIEITNFSYLRRKNYRPENKFFILHEGPLGVFNDTLKEVSYEEIEEENEIVEITKNGWIGYTDHYWQVTIFPENDQPFKARFKNLKNDPNSIQIDFINDSIKSLSNNDSFKTRSFIFAGAKEVPLIDRYIEELNINKLDLSVDFGWFYFLTKPLFYALHFLSGLFGNFGIGIIILTICIRVILFPLANKSFKSMNAMRILTPEIQRLRERYKDDKAKMNQEMFAMYKEKKINPASGCLPILIQIPIFFALYKVLFVSIETVYFASVLNFSLFATCSGVIGSATTGLSPTNAFCLLVIFCITSFKLPGFASPKYELFQPFIFLSVILVSLYKSVNFILPLGILMPNLSLIISTTSGGMK